MGEIIFVRFGVKGASVSFSKALYNLQTKDYFILSKCDEFNNQAENIMYLDRSSFFKFVFSSFRIISFLLKNSNKVVILMPSPFDWLCVFKKGGKETVSIIIHDDKTHLGDNRFKESFTSSYWKIIKPNILTLSKYVSKSLEGKGFVVGPVLFHPYFVSEEIKPVNFNERKFDFGFFGRFKSYQGVAFIEKFRNGLDSNNSILYCGGSQPIIQSKKINETCVYGKITDEIFFNLMSQTKNIILPYTEATQSGVIPNALKLNCQVIVTDVGGLREQDILNDFVIISLSDDSIKELNKMDKYNRPELNKSIEKISPLNFYEKLKNSLV
ncbi:MAG: hypothetical protein RLY43_1061 [Bacteroidota bacterium]|jgi:hypothetical protein